MHVVARLIQVNAALWGYVLWWACVRGGLLRPKTPPAERLAAVLERLGTSFVKLGQGLALHRELLPDDYVVALARLQENVESFSFDQARAEIEATFERPLEALFVEIDAVPMAAGSVAQIHRARLRDGRPVVVKVRRPGIRRQVAEDIRILRWFVVSVQWLVPGLRRIAPLQIVDELAHNLQQELDFRREAEQIAYFAEAFRGSTTVFVPGVADELYGERVVVQEMSPGAHLDAPFMQGRGAEVAQRLVDAYLHQFFVLGVFHGDPHPGNVFVLADGRICLHDFGLVGYLDRRTRTGLMAVMLAFAQNDGAWLLDAYLDLGIVGGAFDRRAFQSALDELIRDYARKPLKDWSFAEALLRIARMGQGRNARVPHNLLVLSRATFLMESTVRRLDPDFNLMEGLCTRAGGVLQAQAAPKEQHGMPSRLQYEAMVAWRLLPTDMGELLHRLRTEGVQLSLNHHGLDELQRELDRGSGRIARALVAAGLFVAASLLVQDGAGPRWGDTPVLAVLGYAAAAVISWRLVRKP